MSRESDTAIGGLLDNWHIDSTELEAACREQMRAILRASVRSLGARFLLNHEYAPAKPLTSRHALTIYYDDSYDKYPLANVALGEMVDTVIDDAEFYDWNMDEPPVARAYELADELVRLGKLLRETLVEHAKEEKPE